MSSRLNELIKSFSRIVYTESSELDPITGLEVEDELYEQDRIIDELAQNARNKRETTTAQWKALFSGVQEDAKGAHANRTRKNYEGQIRRLNDFVRDYCPSGSDELTTLSENTPWVIALWIRYYCGKPKTSWGDTNETVSNPELHDNLFCSGPANSWAAASNMRAAATYLFVCERNQSNTPYTDNRDGTFSGNPCNSPQVQRYMRSLKRQKAREGLIQSSVKAITVGKLEELFRFNAGISCNTGISPSDVGSDGGRTWARWRQRVMMSLAYAVAFLCLLRLDEVLNIKVQHFRWLDNRSGKVELTLSFRKTRQAGEVPPFYLYHLPETPWLNVPALLAEWIHISGIKTGYLFSSFYSNGQVKLENGGQIKKLSHSSFLQDFRHNLNEIGEEVWLYGGHSFRRGAAQWFITDKRWSVIRLCQYGGWSKEFDAPTIMRYLYNVIDETGVSREDMMNPALKHGTLCTTCGRKCNH